MFSNETIRKLREIHMGVMAEQLSAQLEDPQFRNVPFEDRLAMLVDAEWSARKSNRLTGLIKKAGYADTQASVENIEYIAERHLDREQILRLASCSYIQEARNVIILGATGAGKTFLACSLGVADNRNFCAARYLRLPNLLVVADGMGGHKAGDFASKYTVEVLKEELKHTLKDGPEEILKDAAQTANHKLIEKADEDINLEGMGTTLVAATVIDHTLYFINVGDSRLYLLNKDIRQLSRDHSLVEEMVRLGGINEEEARHHPDKNIITRAIGVKEDVEVDFYEFSLKKGDIILMCSDGLSNMIEDEEIFAIVKGARDIVEAGQNLIDRANENGGNDNISVVLAEPFSDEVSIW